MPKRKRHSEQLETSIERRTSARIGANDAALATTDQRARTPHLESDQDGEEVETNRTQRDGITSTNGLFTPVSAQSGSDFLRKKTGLVSYLNSATASDIDESSDSSTDSDTPQQAPPKVERLLSHVEIPGWKSGPAFSRHLYGYSENMEVVRERQALSELVETHRAAHAEDEEKPEYTYIQLDQFCIYQPITNKNHALALVALHELSRDRHQEFCFDGILSVGNERRYVQDVRFRVLTVDGYDDADATDMENQLCVQSLLASHQGVWYKLGSPGPEYRRFYEPFLWVARFTKHAVQYMLTTEAVTLQHFRSRFYEWLQRGYRKEVSFLEWSSASGTRDFAVHFAAFADFLWKESHGVQQPSDEIKICEHPVWSETLPYPDRLKAIPRQASKQGDKPKTIVTPFAFNSFKSMYFGDQLLETTVTDQDILRRVNKLKQQRGLAPWYSQLPSKSVLAPSSGDDTEIAVIKVAVGDVVAVSPDDVRWKSGAEVWYAYVQRVWQQKDGRTRLDVIWLYHPQDTTIGKAQCMFPNELFFSDNCGCGSEEAFHLDQVLHKVNIAWQPSDPFRQQGLFVRQKFRTVAEMDHYDFRKLQQTDFRCCHQVDYIPEPEPTYQIGDTVLVRKHKDAKGTNCEPAQIVGFSKRGTRVRVRRLPRKQATSPSSKPNELLLSQEVRSRSCDKLVRECHVRFFSKEQIKDGLPTPYDRDGAGDYFFIVSEGNESGDSDAQTATFPPLQQGWDPTEATPCRKLRGLGMFCGGGTFDRGLEEGGAVRFTHAVDYAAHALHSYKANASEPVKFFLGSVDDYLSNAMSGQTRDVTATAGEIELISAGSPCQGFSKMQLKKMSKESRKNASMVASVVSFVDFYVPEYLVFENVVPLTQDLGGQNVFSQILAALVGMGYQVQQFLMDSWSSGSPQQRSRVFIIATAPNAAPLPQPEVTHSHPFTNFRKTNLGRSSNGLPFGTRYQTPYVALPFVTAEQAVADLPKLYDSVPQLCVRFPDHRLARLVPPVERGRIAMIPTRPRGWGLAQAYKTGKLRGEPLKHFEDMKNGKEPNKPSERGSENSKGYSRIYPEYLFPTITTTLSIADARNGRTLHWDQHRPITLMEARRAQGYLDHEVLVGHPVKQMLIVGNSVDRKVALVLGLALRKSWIKTHQDMNLGGDDDSVADISAAVKRDATSVSALDESPSPADTTADSEVSPPEASPQSSTSGEHLAHDIDNRTVKMALNLSQEEIDGIRKAAEEGRGAFKEILRLMHLRDDHRAARASLHRGNGEGEALHGELPLP